jgi:hypothetical protein
VGENTELSEIFGQTRLMSAVYCMSCKDVELKDKLDWLFSLHDGKEKWRENFYPNCKGKAYLEPLSVES